jgi:hypothetical protein
MIGLIIALLPDANDKRGILFCEITSFLINKKL